MSKWLKVKDMPMEEFVLLYHNDDSYSIGRAYKGFGDIYYIQDYCTGSRYLRESVIRWMPLPSKPEENQE